MSKTESKDYYTSGSNEVASLSAVTLKKLKQRQKLTKTNEKLVICLVGLPGRGKSFIARKMQSFLLWRGVACEVFNVGKYRRAAQAQVLQESMEQQSDNDDTTNSDSNTNKKNLGACDANFFDSHNPQARALRELSASLAMKDMLAWLDKDAIPSTSLHGGDRIGGLHRRQSGLKATYSQNRVAIFDATNSTAQRRKWVLEECTSPTKRPGKTTGVVFVESVCDDQELLEENFTFKIRHSPDYAGMTEEDAIMDLRQRVKKYEEQYETVDDDEQSYIKIFNLSSKLLVNHIYGRMAKVIVPCLMSFNIGSRAVYLCRPGETQSTEVNGFGKLARGDTLGKKGIEFRDGLEQFMRSEWEEFSKQRRSRMLGTSMSGLQSLALVDDLHSDTDSKFACHVMSSTMPRALETVTWSTLPVPIHELSNLNPLDKGDFSGMENDEIQQKDPEWWACLEEDPFLTRFPGGECYADLIQRLETCVIDMEQQVNMVCVVSHLSVLQVLLAYFRRTPIDQCTGIEVPMNTVIKFSPVTGGGWKESKHQLLLDEPTDGSHSFEGGEGHLTKNTRIWSDPKKSSSSDNHDPVIPFCCS